MLGVMEAMKMELALKAPVRRHGHRGRRGSRRQVPLKHDALRRGGVPMS